MQELREMSAISFMQELREMSAISS